MKFAEHLGAHITPEWRKQYIQYEALKDLIYEAYEQSPSTEVTDVNTLQRYYARFDESFFQFCDRELTKINTFFYEKISEANRKFANLRAELDAFLEHANKPHGAHKPHGLRRRKSAAIYSLFKDKENRENTQTHTRKLHDLKLAFSEFYLSLILLQNYQSLNFTGFRKILKKHDKIMVTTRGVEWRQQYVETAPFYTNKEVDHLIKETERNVTEDLEGGNRQKAMKRLRVPPLGEKQNPMTTFRVGLFFGMFSMLVIVAVVTAFFTNSSAEWEPALRMYRGMFLVIMMICLLGINTYGWRSSGVNHVLIFEIDPRRHLSHHQLLELAAFLAVVFTISLLGYLFSEQLGVSPFIFPLAMGGFLLIYLLNPLHILHHSSRYWLLTILFRIVTAPFHHVGFADFWLADQLNSLAIVLLDFEYMICYYAFEVEWHGSNRAEVCTLSKYGIRSIFSVLPAWFRFAQCLRRYRDTKLAFPHLVNAGKYSTTFFVVLFSGLYSATVEWHGNEYKQNHAFFYLWIISAVISSCYTLTWDLKMDWGILDRNAGENRFLREEIVYAYKAYYYFAIVEDFILRFVWTLTVSVGENPYFEHKEVLVTLLASLELFRRFIWNFFRLENEHLNNCGQFRAVRDISIVPIDSNDQSQLEELMDDDDDGDLARTCERRRLLGKASKKERGWIDDDDQTNLKNIPMKFKGV